MPVELLITPYIVKARVDSGEKVLWVRNISISNTITNSRVSLLNPLENEDF